MLKTIVRCGCGKKVRVYKKDDGSPEVTKREALGECELCIARGNYGETFAEPRQERVVRYGFLYWGKGKLGKKVISDAEKAYRDKNRLVDQLRRRLDEILAREQDSAQNLSLIERLDAQVQDTALPVGVPTHALYKKKPPVPRALKAPRPRRKARETHVRHRRG